MIKSYTDLEQSKKLAEILPLESADMFWMLDSIDHYEAVNFPYSESCANEDDGYPCWSLAALVSILPDYTLQTNSDGTVFVVCDSKKPMISDSYDNPIDACMTMVEKLHKLNLL